MNTYLHVLYLAVIPLGNKSVLSETQTGTSAIADLNINTERGLK